MMTDPNHELEYKIIKILNLVLLFAASLAVIINISMGLNLKMTFASIIFLIFFLIVFIFLKRDRLFKLIKVVLTLSIFIGFNLSWIINYGSSGLANIIMFVLAVLIIILWNKKTALIFLTVEFINILALYTIELNFPDITGHYPSNDIRLIDLFFGSTISFLIISYYMLTTKENLSTQFLKALESDKLKSLFLRNISHEIRTPLNAITGFSELLANPDTSINDRNLYSKIVTDNSKSLANLINNILDISNIESDQLILLYNSFNVPIMINRILAEEKASLAIYGKQDIAINCHIPDFDIFLNSDESRIEQIIRNLIENSVKFTKEGSIDIWVKKENNKLFFTITDTGIGIDSSHIDKIFDRFYKVSETTTLFSPGTGIGLYLVKELLRLLKGDITVNSKPGEGSTFTFFVPDYVPKSDINL